MRIGQGYDVHRLVAGRALILGGIAVPFERGLLGHSDADVLTHAVIDAILGGAGLGDIGQMFPDSDPVFRDASSILLLTHAIERVKKSGYRVGNVDSTIVAQAPKLAAYLPKMRAALAGAMGVPVSHVNIKATTEEALGFTGREEGMAAQAVALLLPV